jgi:hypothetical protein
MLENTPEFNRGFELHANNLELDGQVYQPAPQIVPDTRTGYDLNGDYHAVPDVSGNDEYNPLRGIGEAITPFRWRDYLQDAIRQYSSTCDYDMGAGEIDDLACQIVAERMDNCCTTLERYQLEKALELWRESYGRGYRINHGNK